MHNDAFDGRDPADPAPFSLLRPRADSAVLLVCDHASNRVPQGLRSLGLDREHLYRHIGWDIGAADVTRSLSHRLRATASTLRRVSPGHRLQPLVGRSDLDSREERRRYHSRQQRPCRGRSQTSRRDVVSSLSRGDRGTARHGSSAMPRWRPSSPCTVSRR